MVSLSVRVINLTKKVFVTLFANCYVPREAVLGKWKWAMKKCPRGKYETAN